MCVFLGAGCIQERERIFGTTHIQFCESRNIVAYRALAEHGVWLNGIIHGHAHCAVGVIYNRTDVLFM